MTAERNSYTGTATQTPNPAKPRPAAPASAAAAEYLYCGATIDRRDAAPGPSATRASLCAAPCPHGHAHTCARSPQHCGPHRDVKQKGDESCSWPGEETVAADPDASLDLDAIRDRANAATKGPWGVEHEGGVMILNRGTCQAVAFVGSEDDDQVQADAAFLAAAREDVPALLAEVDRLITELAAANEVADDALTLAEQAAADRRSLRTEVDRLRRLLETRDADYALVIRVAADGRTQVDGRPGVSVEQAAIWLQEITEDTVRRAAQ